MSTEKSLCENRWTYPVVSLGRGEFRFCCRSEARRISEEELQASGSSTFINSEYDKERRLEMLQGIRQKDCAVCWQMEDKGFRSPRLTTPNFSDKQGFQTPMPLSEWEKIKEMAASTPEWLKAKPQMLEVMLSNACDMKCIYCSHHYSTKWAQELVQFGELSPSQMEKEFPTPAASFEPTFWQALEKEFLPHIWQVNIIGGEPLLSEKLYAFLARLDDLWRGSTRATKNHTLRINIVTNLNCSPAQLQRFLQKCQTLNKHFLIELNVSMESFGARAEYIRFGLNWDRWVNNFRELMATKLVNVEVSLQLATNVLSITSLKELLALAKSLVDEFDRPISLRRNAVSTPAYLSPAILTPAFAPYFDECIHYLRSLHKDVERFDLPIWGKWDYYADFLQSMRDSIVNGKPEQQDQQLFYKFIKKNDFRRGLDFARVFPEYQIFFRMCEQLAEPTRKTLVVRAKNSLRRIGQATARLSTELFSSF